MEVALNLVVATVGLPKGFVKFVKYSAGVVAKEGVEIGGDAELFVRPVV